MWWDEWGKIMADFLLGSLVSFIREAYNLMHDILKMSCDEMSQVRSWYFYHFAVL